MIQRQVGVAVLLVLTGVLLTSGIAYAQSCSRYLQPNMILSWKSYVGDEQKAKGTVRIVSRTGAHVKAVQFTDDNPTKHVLNGEVRGQNIIFTYTDWDEVWRGRCDASGIYGTMNEYSFMMWAQKDGIASQKKDTRVEWVPTTGNAIPDKGIVGGEEPGRQLYLCRAKYMGEMASGKAANDFNGCYIGWRGGEYILQNYDVLSGDADLLKWVPSNIGNFMQAPDPFFAGTQRGLNVYICRMQYNGGWHPGHVIQGGKGCIIGYGGGEASSPNFDVLTWR